MNLKEFKNKALQNVAFKEEYEKYDLAFEIGQMVVEARILKGLTQQGLAKLVHTKQPSIARLENGQNLPSLSFLEKIAEALDTQLLAPKFSFFVQEPTVVNIFIAEPSLKISTSSITPVACNNTGTSYLTKTLTTQFT